MAYQHTYLIQLRGAIGVEDLNACAPLCISEVRREAATTQVTVTADQAGLIGLMRHLHGLGIQFLSVKCESDHQEHQNG